MSNENKNKEAPPLTIRQEERRRANNQIWNTAGDYSYVPSFRAYDDNGRAELYWNGIIGCAQKHFGNTLDPLWEIISTSEAQDLCEQLVWMGLENACFEREKELRPAFPLLRRAYAARLIENNVLTLDGPYGDAFRLHFKKAAGLAEEEELTPEEENADMTMGLPTARAILKRLEFSGTMSGEEICQAAMTFLEERTLLIQRVKPFESSKKFRLHLPFKKKGSGQEKQEGPPPVRAFAAGIGEHNDPNPTHYQPNGKHNIWDMNEKQSDEAIRTFIHNIFGTPLCTDAEMETMERTLCHGDHDNCRIYMAKGDATTQCDIQGYATVLRQTALQRMEKNRDYYHAHYDEARTAINQLTEKWRNAFLTYRQDNTVKDTFGTLQPSRIWRQETVGDGRMFDKILPADNGDFYVDILIDGSLSQEEREQRLALQAYIIAESLTRCRVPVQVCSFCSMSGYTILNQFRGYHENDKNGEIFNFTTTGGNRDGLAMKLMGYLMDHTADRPEHRILLVLSDTRPNDAIYIGSEMYRGDVAVENTAREIRYLKNRGVSVLCVYTGTDDDLPFAHKIYNRDFVRIRTLDHFARAVGELLLTQIRG